MGAWWLQAIGTLITGFCYGLQRYFSYKNYRIPKHIAYYNDGAAYYFKTFLFFLFIRSFIVEWAISPSGSLQPTLLEGERIITDKAAYDIRLPVTGHLLISLAKPKRGDIIVFRSPEKTSVGRVSRLVGLPGDHIVYQNHRLTINGKQVGQSKISVVHDSLEQNTRSYRLCEESLEGRNYQIWIDHDPKRLSSKEQKLAIQVPPHHYFVIGDYRSSKEDSRFFGCVPERNLLGKARRIYLSYKAPTPVWKIHAWVVRPQRLGMKIK